ncbi:siphovirus ReqiPepy6 Gp37-like family protein [Polymorphospora rubra]|uniref:siphovirus ReqiPepy6 Gp37-like family protein n=1 Tax=Polymorphospora rubra TaxID=338584 RepID=UPI0033D68395
MIEILITDRNLRPVGDILDGWTGLDIIGRDREPDSGTFSIPARPDIVAQIQPGNRVVVERDGEILTAGPIEAPGPYQWSASGEHAGDGTQTITWADDSAPIAGRVTYPDPAAAATAQTTVSHWTRSATSAEVVMRDLVRLNAGADALAARRIPRLALGALAGVGTSIDFSTRWEPLGDALRRAALAGGGLGFRTRQVGDEILFEVYEPRDLTSTVWFSRGLGNLQAITYESTAPTVTAAIVGGQGELTARTIRERVDSTAAATWWRIERFLDQTQEEDIAALDQAGDEALAEGAETARLAMVTVDTPDQRYGRDYGLSDKVPVEIHDDLVVVEVVRGYHLQQAHANAPELVTALIGSQEASRDPAWVRVGRDLARRLGQQERR